MQYIEKIKSNRNFAYMAAGSALVATVAFYVIYRYRQSHQTVQIEQSQQSAHQLNDRILYDENIQDKHQFSFANHPIQKKSNLSDLLYKIIFNLNKGNIYQGVVKISFQIKSLKSYKGKFSINYNGTSVKYLAVNSKILDPEELEYENHQIYFDKNLLKEKQLNQIQVIFENKYSFLDEGLSSYFILDESNKYSLKEQVIYSKNGAYQIEKIIPCINCLNECKVSMEVIYPDGFEAFSNSPKSMDQICTAQNYPQYSFFFAQPQRGLNKSFKLNSSFTSQNYDASTLNASTLTKHNSHFYLTTLPSIHNMFLFCSNIVQIQHYSNSSNDQDKMLIRYFGKSNKYENLAKHIPTLHRHVLDVCNRLSDYKIEKYITKIDIFFVGDREIQGYFTPGAIILDQQSMEQGVHIKIFYMIARAILGMVLVINHKQYFKNDKENKQSLKTFLNLKFLLQLNQEVFQRFPQCRGYIFFKQQDCQKAKTVLQNKQFISKNQLRFIQYYYKEIKFIIRQQSMAKLAEKIPFQFKDINERLKNNDTQTYWNHFVSQYNFLSPYVAELLLKISISKKGIPFSNDQLIDFAKSHFSKSKFYLDFFTNQQIQSDLPYFLEGKYHHLQKRLTQIKIKQKFRQHITDQYENYLPIKSNRQEAKSIYEQFKRFKESRNFHHISVLKHQIKRICMFGTDFIAKQRINLDCGFMSWKLLSKIKIFPANSDYKKVINQLELLPISNNSSVYIKKEREFQQ